MPRLCAFGCKPNDVPMHHFPSFNKHPEQFKTWVKLVGGRLDKPSDYKYFQKKRVCDIHFTDRDRNRNNRLNALAVPSLHLSDRQANETASQIASICMDYGSSETKNTDRQATEAATQLASVSMDCGTPETKSTDRQATEAATQLASVSMDCGTPETKSTDRQATEAATLLASVSMDCGTPETKSTDRQAKEAVSQLVTISMNCGMPETSNIETQVLQQQTSTSMQNITSETPTMDTSQRVPRRRVLLEHNYAITTKLQEKFDRGAPKTIPNAVTHLRTKIKHLQSKISRLRKIRKSFHTRLVHAEKISKDTTFQQLVKNMTPAARLLVHMQLQTSKKPKGRRFTTEEKILALSLYKKSPRVYALLHKYFTLPSARAMKRLLSQVKIRPGINPIIFEKIKQNVIEKDLPDRLCCLIFDEMSLSPQVAYNANTDELEGFATNNPTAFADHALVFMVKGIKNNFKQPVAYYFTNSLNKIELKRLIKTVVTHTQKAGLTIVNTVCDQSSVNTGAISELVNDAKAKHLRLGKQWHHDVMSINGRNIIPIYDAPHLIKGVRNNLLTKDLIYESSNTKKIVKWKYLQMVYAADKSYGELRLLNKITEEHVNPSKISKMRVKLATQIFSHSVAVVTEHLVARGNLPEECRQLIEVTLLLDNVFDSLNVSTFKGANGKIYKKPIKRHSPHHQLWVNAKKILKSIRFRYYKKTGNKTKLVETTVPSVLNFIKTIEGVEAIWKVLSDKYGFDALLTRNLNQDPLENFFGSIRSYGGRNNSPNTGCFEGAFKALLLNNYNTPHSKRANCEEDNNKCLQSLAFFLTEKPDSAAILQEEPEGQVELRYNEEMLNFAGQDADSGQRNYVCGWVLRKCLKHVVKTCETCRHDLIDTENQNKNNTFTKAKEYNNKYNLCYPSRALETCFYELQHIVCASLKKNYEKKNVKKNLICFSDLMIDYPFHCPLHRLTLKKYFADITINILLCSWCRSINRILAGKITYDGDDETKTAAQTYFDKHKHNKNKK